MKPVDTLQVPLNWPSFSLYRTPTLCCGLPTVPLSSMITNNARYLLVCLPPPSAPHYTEPEVLGVTSCFFVVTPSPFGATNLSFSRSVPDSSSPLPCAPPPHCRRFCPNFIASSLSEVSDLFAWRSLRSAAFPPPHF